MRLYTTGIARGAVLPGGSLLSIVVLAGAILGIPGRATAHETGPSDPPLDLEPLSDVPCDLVIAGEYPCRNVDLLAFAPIFPLGEGQASDIWGWTHPPTGVEYAILGLAGGTAFYDLGDPRNPVYLGLLPTQTRDSGWRDMKVDGHHAFIVSEADRHGMQVFDLNALTAVAAPPVTFAPIAHYDGFKTAHNIAVNRSTGFAYAVGTDDCGGGLHMIDIANPASPAFAGCYAGDGYTHDAQCVTYHGPDAAHQGREICFAANEDTLTVVDVTSKAAPVLLSRTGYTGARYVHQGWLTDDHAHMFLSDELDEMLNSHGSRTYVFDLADLTAPILTGSYTAFNAAIDHNLYVRGRFLFQANYQSGFRLLRFGDLTSPPDVSLVGYFDTHPDSDDPQFNGMWSVYPYFPSGIVIGSDIERGLYVMAPDADVDSFNVTADCDDTDAAVHTAPGETPGLLFPAHGDTLTWLPPAQQGGAVVTYDTLRSPAPAGFAAAGTCVESADGGDTLATDPALPARGAVFYYLVRARNGCPGGGPAGTTSGGLPRLVPLCPTP